MSRLEQNKTVDPQVLQVILLDEMCGRLEELGEQLDRQAAYNRFMGPVTRPFKRMYHYQYETVAAGASGRVWFMKNPQPDLLIGIINEVGNSWFADTYYEWEIDYEPQQINYEIATVNEPRKYGRGIPFVYQVEWTAYNNDDASHVFEVFMNGFFIPKKVYEKVTGGTLG